MTSQTKRGTTVIQHEGYTFGKQAQRKKNDKAIWTCTKSCYLKNTKRCPATIATRTIGGYLKLRINNPKHLCRRKYELGK